jgi:hypothetical protein
MYTIEFIELEPPTILPRGRYARRPPSPGSDSLSKSQSQRVLNKLAKAAGTWISVAVSHGPASTSATDTLESSDKRAAKTHPAEPAPTTT